MTASSSTRTRRSLPPWLGNLIIQASALLGAFTFAALIGSLIIIGYHENPIDIYSTIWHFGVNRPEDIASVLVNATPLIFSGLAVAVAFKGGLFNIGVEGQYIVGMMGAAFAAIFLRSLPGPLLLIATVLGSIVAAMIWAFIPAILKVKTGAHEVVTTIMMNGVAVSLVAWTILNPLRSHARHLIDLRSQTFPHNALIPTIAQTFGLQQQIPPVVRFTWLFPVALIACVLVWFLMYRSRLGYEVRAIGSSMGSAEAGGVSIGATQIKIFLISGALAGFVGLNQILGDKGYLGANYEAGLGFAGITVAFLGRNNPIGIVLASLLVGFLSRGQDGLSVTSNLPIETLIILQGVLILSVIIAYELVSRALNKRTQREARSEESAVDTTTTAGAEAT